ncbi:MAG: hypothetical protein KAR79_00110 [Simkaniaceae bacterium]|nr:hypothetical protein [Simkaniaceae bacterium]
MKKSKKDFGNQGNITSIINFCTNDFRYLALCIKEVKLFSSQVIIAVCDHFFDGTPEDRELLSLAYAMHPDCEFIEYAYDAKKAYGSYRTTSPESEDWTHFWHSTSRYVGYHFARSEYLLFLDVDEIIDGSRFQSFFASSQMMRAPMHRLLSYFYFKSPTLRSRAWHPGSLVVKKSAIEPEHLLNILERHGVFMDFEGSRVQNAVGLDGKPLVHHYSWVRLPDELLRKVQMWGHKHDRDWVGAIEKGFNQPFEGKDPIFGLTYERVEPLHDPLKINVKDLLAQHVSRQERAFENVTKITGDMLREQSLRSIFGC